jgi:hypothetical protein
VLSLRGLPTCQKAGAAAAGRADKCGHVVTRFAVEGLEGAEMGMIEER